jgi:hypothetical protein
VAENINRPGVRRWFSTTKFPFYDAAGTAQGIVGSDYFPVICEYCQEAIALDQSLVI